MDIPTLLENRHLAYLEWAEPWPGTSKDGNRVDCQMMIRATVHDCINYHRKPGQPDQTDADVLKDFLSVHWAFEVTKTTKRGAG